MPEKKVFALRISEDILKAVERWAADDFRSMNGQLEWIIHKALREAGRKPVRPEQEISDSKKEVKE